MIQNNNNREKFQFFKSFDDYMDYVDKNWDSVPDDYRSKSSSTFTNPSKKFVGSDDLELLKGKIKEFIDPKALDSAVDNIKELFSLIDLGGAFAKDKMVATDLPIGVFDFSLASQGLFRPQEYYSPELNKIINPDFVKTISGNPTTYTYTEKIDGEKKTFNLIQQQEGTFSLKEKNEYISQLISEGKTEQEATILATDKFPNAKLVFRTKTKKVNLIRQSKVLKENQVDKEKYVDLFINVGGLKDQTPRSLMFKAMPCLLLSYFLDKAGIKTRILGLFANTVSAISESRERSPNRYMESFVIKDYEEGLDFNEIAIITADSRVFRYKVFKAIVVNFYKMFNLDIGSGLGRAITQTAFSEMFERYKKFYVKEGVLGNAKVRNQNTRLMFSSSKVVNPESSDEVLLNGVIEEFFKLIDAIDIEFNGARVSLPRIKKREEKRGVDISNLRQRLKTTILQNTNYDESTSPYTNTEKEILERSRLRKKLIEDIDENFKNY